MSPYKIKIEIHILPKYNCTAGYIFPFKEQISFVCLITFNNETSKEETYREPPPNLGVI
jgi:hypothetical protein